MAKKEEKKTLRWRYSTDLPEGKILELTDSESKALEAKGWVDSPDKLKKGK